MSRAPARHLLGQVLAGIALLAIVLALAWLQPGPWWPGAPAAGRIGWTAAAGGLWLGLSAWCLWPRRAAGPTPTTEDAAGADTVLVAHASQTGFAQQLAELTAQALRQGGRHVRVLPLGQVDAPLLLATRQALFIASTTGEGDPPDPALAFVGSTMRQTPALAGLSAAVLALGDRGYARFCAFGIALDGWLRACGAQPLFDRVDVDNADPAALRHWQHHVGMLAGDADLPDWSAPRYQQWTLQDRRLLNPGSAGGQAWAITLAPPAGATLDWHAGDIAEIGPRHAPETVSAWLHQHGRDGRALVRDGERTLPLADALAGRQWPEQAAALPADPQALLDGLPVVPHREYSIASLPSESTLQLLVRRMLRPDGTPGIGSGWLCASAPSGGPIDVRLRSNPNFHAPAADVPLVLVGNGTGIAGLRALLAERVAAGATRTWLLFGERSRAHDFFFGQELLAWQAEAALERLDLAFSRDGAARTYVQDVLRQQAGRLVEWVDAGAAVYVCGSLEGMAPGVDAVMADALGVERVAQLRMAGRYRRDVY